MKRDLDWIVMKALDKDRNRRYSTAGALAEDVSIRLVVFNLLGQVVATLADEPQHAGYHTIPWDASGLSGGMYLYRLEAGGFVETRAMLLLK